MEDEGGEATFDAFFDDTWPRLQSQAYVLTGSHEQAQDMTQEDDVPPSGGEAILGLT
jgi:DNA-directed RNA polymerase specialized sigma24 family protein